MATEVWALDVPSLLSSLKTSAVPFIWSWRGAVLIFALLNVKSLPFVWTARTYYHLKTSFGSQRRRLIPSANNPQKKVVLVKKEKSSDPVANHPLFQPDVINTHVPLLEIDMNLHKSNSTFFTDLDVSRIKLMGRIIAPAWPMDCMDIEYKGRDGQLKRERIKGQPALILGATHTSFKRELKPFASYNVESRILGWDTRWIYVGSWFVSKGKPKGNPKQIFATSLSKYIIKKGRITVRPEQFLTECGWIPAKASDDKSLDNQNGNSWSWDEIEAYRVKGMEIVQAWGETDVLLEREYNHQS